MAPKKEAPPAASPPEEEEEPPLELPPEMPVDKAKLCPDVLPAGNSFQDNKDIGPYGRAVVITDYQFSGPIEFLVKELAEHNEAFVKGSRTLNTYTVNLDDEKELNSDFISSWCIFDGKMRVMFLEGHRSTIDGILPSRPWVSEGKKGRLLYNRQLGWRTRLYGAFNLVPKHVRLRHPLNKLLLNYAMFHNEDDEGALHVFAALHQIADLLRFDSMLQADMTGFPAPQALNLVETYFGFFVSDEELRGEVYIDPEVLEQRRKKAKRLKQKEAARGGKPKSKSIMKSRASSAGSLMSAYSGAKSVKSMAYSDDATTAAGSGMDLKAKSSRGESEESLPPRKGPTVCKNPVYVRHVQNRERPDVFMRNLRMVEDISHHSALARARSTTPPRFVDPFVPSSAMQMRSLFKPKKGDIREKSRYIPQCALRSLLSPRFLLPRPRSLQFFREPARDLTNYRRHELTLEWQENEWNRWPGKPRGVPLDNGERPFAPDLIPVHPYPFGPKELTRSIHDLGVPYSDEVELINRESAKAWRWLKEKGGGKPFRSKVLVKTDTARHITPVEAGNSLSKLVPILRDEPQKRGLMYDKCRRPPSHIRKRFGLGVSDENALDVLPAPVNMQMEESWDEQSPAIEFQARMRGNDDMAPLNVVTDGLLPRSHEAGVKRGWLVGGLGPAPWRHKTKEALVTAGRCAASQPWTSCKDFSRYPPPPQRVDIETKLHKNPRRKSYTITEARELEAKGYVGRWIGGISEA